MNTLENITLRTSNGVYNWTLGDDPNDLVHIINFLQRCLDARELTVALAAQPPLPPAQTNT